jgi:heterodisulfide reductase subunit A-like polyferredoxin
MKAIIKENRLNRVVVAACSPKTHQPIFQDTLTACGLNKHLFEMANIRNQDSWVHSSEPEAATKKARELVRMAVARAATLESLKGKVVPINKQALVVGGGIAGMNAALSLADQGFPTVLVEKEAELGGFSRHLHHTIEGADIQDYLRKLRGRVTSHAKIEVLTGSAVSGFAGFKGNFTTDVLVGPEKKARQINHGAVILATGAHEYRPTEYLYGEDERVMTQVELSQRLSRKDLGDPKQVVMIQCVGSRNAENPNCSRVCCQTAVKNALHIKEQYPEAEVYVLYRDIRTYGLLENYYTEARRRGVLFFRFEPENPPKVVKSDGGIEVTFVDHVLQRPLSVAPDILVLSAGMQATDTADLSMVLKAARTPEGFFMEAHVKLRPVDMAAEGFYVCGTAHGPKLISETIAQAQAAAARAGTLLALDSVSLSAITAKVITEYCVKCLTCVRSCPFGVPQFNTDEKVIEINEALCQGCGVCTAVCPRQTINLSFYEDEQIMCKIDALLAEEVE